MNHLASLHPGSRRLTLQARAASEPSRPVTVFPLFLAPVHDFKRVPCPLSFFRKQILFQKFNLRIMCFSQKKCLCEISPRWIQENTQDTQRPPHQVQGSPLLDFPASAADKNGLPMQGTWVRSLTGEDSTCLGATKPLCHKYLARAPQQEKPPQ